MKKYIIKTHYEASETNKNFKGAIHDIYLGKSEMRVGGWDGYKTEEPLSLQMVAYWGYDRKCDAVRTLKSRQELNAWETSHGHWIVTSELVEIEV